MSAEDDKPRPDKPRPDKPQKPSGREARLAQALRDNLRRRKQAQPPKPEDGGEH